MVEIAINIDQIDEMCRLCLSTGVMLLDIFKSTTSMQNRVADVIMQCAPVKITKSDAMPKFICRSCYTKLKKNHQFQTQIVQSEKTLQRYLQQFRVSDKQIKIECSEDLLIHGVNAGSITVKTPISTECGDDPVETFSRYDNCEMSCEDAKNFCNNRKFIEDRWEEKLSANFNQKRKVEEATLSFGIKEQLIDDNSSFSSECTYESSETFSYGSKIHCKDPKININRTSRKSERLCSADITEDFVKREEETTLVNNMIHKEASKIEYKCDVCKNCFLNSSSLSRHRRSHVDMKLYECDVCKKCFTQTNTLKIHKRLHSDEKPYQCRVCNMHFTQLSNLINHERHCDDGIENFKKRKPRNKIAPKKNVISKGENKNEYKCDSCNKSFRDLCSLSKHKRTHQKPYQCDICNKQFSSLGNLNTHKLTHTGEKPYMCEMCSKCFSKSDHLKIHTRIHTGEKPYVCDVCEKHFAHLHGLKRHKRTHTGEKPYLCDVCNKQFAQSTHLKIHSRIHTGEKPYQCNLCNKRFASSGCVAMHKRTHTGESSYQCDIPPVFIATEASYSA